MVALFGFCWLIFYIGKPYLTFIKAAFPFNKSKGRLIIEIDNSTKFGNIILTTKIKDTDIIKIEKNSDPLRERFLYVDKIIHQTAYGLPLIFCLKKNNNQIVVGKHDFTLLIDKINDVILSIHSVNKKGDIDLAKELRIDTLRFLNDIKPQLEYLQPAIEIIDKQLQREDNLDFNNLPIIGNLGKLDYYHDTLIRVRELLFSKNKEFIKFKDLYTDAKLTKSERQSISYAKHDSFLKAQMGMQAKNAINIIFIVLFVICIVIGLINMFSTGGVSDTLTGIENNINISNKNISDIKMYTVKVDSNGNTVPVNNVVITHYDNMPNTSISGR